MSSFADDAQIGNAPTPMGSLATRARAALASRLRTLLPPEALHQDGAHALRFADALVPTLSAADVAWARAQLAARAKGEVQATRTGAVPAHAAGSSTGLVCSAFAAWRARPEALAIPGITGPFARLRLEERLLIPHGGGTPNLDVALDGPSGLVGVEAKLTEHLAARAPRPWKPAYRRPPMAAALDQGWRAVFEDLLMGRWTPRHLDAAQLVRHALSLRGAGRLVYLHWEPASRHAELEAHREEAAELVERVGDAVPRLHVLTWDALWEAWAGEAPGHVAALRARYDVPVA